MIDYIELHCHSNFSFLDGASSIEEIVEMAKRQKMSALALTDHNGLYGAPRFFKICKEEGLKAIIGAELTLKGDHHIILLAENKEGYSNLSRLITKAQLKGGRDSPFLEISELEEHSKGLICLSGCRKGEISKLLLSKKYEEAKKIAGIYLDIFGRENFFIEIQNHLYPDDKRLIESLLSISKSLNLLSLATNNVHYAKKERYRLHDVLLCIKNRKGLDDCKDLRLNSEFYLKSKEEMVRLFPSLPHLLSNTLFVAERCNVKLDFSSFRFPEFPLPENESQESYLRRICIERLKEKYERIDGEIERRLFYELELIKKLGLSGYFLIVFDIMEFARKNGIPAQGRGSAANSLVAYLLGITRVDPIKNRLFLGRFLNEEMVSIPDIDIDVATKDRERLIRYVYEKYGYEHVAMASTYVTFQARKAIREVGKVLGFQKELLDRMAKSVSVYSAEDIEEDLKRLERFKNLFPSKLWQTFISLCKEIANFPRHLSIHVGGMVISSCPLTDLVPLQNSRIPGRLICQWDKEGIEDAGLIKIDLLGLRMLSLIDEAKKLIEKRRGIKIEFEKIPLDDKRVYEMIGSGDTIGVFQLESRAQIQTLPRTRPNSIEDLTIEVAIIRPGPLQGNMVHPYIRRKNGLEKPDFLHPSLKPILEETLGVILFQEQVLQVAIKIAGLTDGEAELLRRSMSRKRSKEEIEKMKERFLSGARKNGIDERSASLVFEAIKGFASYGFCKSHAAGFAILAYESAWLKKYYPLEFYTALLNNQPMGFYSPFVIVNDAKRHGISILLPDINRSEEDCTVEGETIRLGLKYVKGLGKKTIRKIVEERQRGSFSGLEDFLLRTGLEKDKVENLILAGAFESFGLSERELLWNLDSFEKKRGILFSSLEKRVKLKEIKDFKKAGIHIEITGVSPLFHPLALLRKGLSEKGLLKSSEITKLPQEKEITVGGLIICRQKPETAKGFCFLTLEDEEGMINVIVKPSVYEKFKETIKLESLIAVKGKIQREDRILNVVAHEIIPLKEILGLESIA